MIIMLILQSDGFNHRDKVYANWYIRPHKKIKLVIVPARAWKTGPTLIFWQFLFKQKTKKFAQYF